MNKQRKGFTLIELLVVIAIIALLSTLAVVALNNAREKSRDAKRVSDVKQIQTALELFYADQGQYPTGTTTAIGPSTPADAATDLDCLDDTGFTITCDPTATKYMEQVPGNPSPGGESYTYSGLQEDGSACATGDVCASYNLTFELEGQTGSLAGTAHTATPGGIQ